MNNTSADEVIIQALWPGPELVVMIFGWLLVMYASTSARRPASSALVGGGAAGAAAGAAGAAAGAAGSSADATPARTTPARNVTRNAVTTALRDWFFMWGILFSDRRGISSRERQPHYRYNVSRRFPR